MTDRPLPVTALNGILTDPKGTVRPELRRFVLAEVRCNPRGHLLAFAFPTQWGVLVAGSTSRPPWSHRPRWQTNWADDGVDNFLTARCSCRMTNDTTMRWSWLRRQRGVVRASAVPYHSDDDRP